MSNEIIQHMLHPAPATQINEAPRDLQLVVQTRADEKYHEVAVYLDGHSSASYIAHSYHPSVVSCRGHLTSECWWRGFSA